MWFQSDDVAVVILCELLVLAIFILSVLFVSTSCLLLMSWSDWNIEGLFGGKNTVTLQELDLIDLRLQVRMFHTRLYFPTN